AVLAGAILISGALAIRTPTLPSNIRLDTTGTSATPQDAALAQSVATLSARLNDLARAVGPTPRQNSCRPDRTMTPGAQRERVGSIRTSIQGPGGGAHAAAGERIAAGGRA